MDVLCERCIDRLDIREQQKGGGSTNEIVSDVPSPNDTAGEEGQNENDTVNKLKPRSRQIDFVLLIRNIPRGTIPRTSAHLRTA